jgi:hypothetical protein
MSLVIVFPDCDRHRMRMIRLRCPWSTCRLVVIDRVDNYAAKTGCDRQAAWKDAYSQVYVSTHLAWHDSLLTVQSYQKKNAVQLVDSKFFHSCSQIEHTLWWISIDSNMIGTVILGLRQGWSSNFKHVSCYETMACHSHLRHLYLPQPSRYLVSSEEENSSMHAM